MRAICILLLCIFLPFILASVGPSGAPVPTSSSNPSFTLIYTNDFLLPLDQGDDNQKIGYPYSGNAGGAVPGAQGCWLPSHVVVKNGTLVLEGYNDTCEGNVLIATGGVSFSGVPQLYGKYEVRMRADLGTGVSICALLWPEDNSWPPEVDFVEDGGDGYRNQSTATMHWSSSNKQMSNTENVQTSEWHTLGVEWTPGQLKYTTDGNVWATVNSSNVPDIKMVMDLQTQSWACGNNWEHCPNSKTPAQVNMYIDWVAIYNYSASGASNPTSSSGSSSSTSLESTSVPTITGSMPTSSASVSVGRQTTGIVAALVLGGGGVATALVLLLLL